MRPLGDDPSISSNCTGIHRHLHRFFLRFFVRTDKIHQKGCNAMHLQDCIAFALREVPHTRPRREKPSCGDVFQRCVVPFGSHADSRTTLNDSDILGRGVPVRRNFKPVSAGESQRVRLSSFHRIALDYSQAQCSTHIDRRRADQRRCRNLTPLLRSWLNHHRALLHRTGACLCGRFCLRACQAWNASEVSSTSLCNDMETPFSGRVAAENARILHLKVRAGGVAPLICHPEPRDASLRAPVLSAVEVERGRGTCNCCRPLSVMPNAAAFAVRAIYALPENIDS